MNARQQRAQLDSRKPSPESKFLFRLFRHNPVACGDTDAVVAMAQMLVDGAEGAFVGPGSYPAPSRNHILKQFTKEYGFDVAEAVTNVEMKKAGDPGHPTVLEHCHGCRATRHRK
ncbi:hypothetical protein B0H10DRAFT_982792 [Mycena sp. CBHHK59/15]|nr:hypothetical protein B0H10DRAFT_982792 [Mycena sp. CBHHK59/15]